MDSVVAAATLFTAATGTQAVSLLGGLPALQDEKHDVIARFARWMADLYPGPLALNPLRPDRLGEDHVAATLVLEPRLACISPARLDDSQLGQAVTVLSRAAPSATFLKGRTQSVGGRSGVWAGAVPRSRAGRGR